MKKQTPENVLWSPNYFSRLGN